MVARNFLARLLTAGFALLLAAPAMAGPTWWEGNAEDVPAAASQTGKPVILYFHSPNAAECIRMEEETWRPMNPVWADLQFIWLKLEPRKDAEFFKHWQINQVPQVVILDAEMRDQLRLRGFMSLEEMTDALGRVQRGVPSVFTTVNGSALPARNPILDVELLKRDPYKGHVYFENFDAYKLIGSISNPPFSPVVQAASRINTSRGTERTSCLEVSTGSSETALIQIDISQKFPTIEQVVGRIRVRAKLKAETSLGNVPVDLMALYVVRTDKSSEDEAEQMYFASLSDKDLNAWRDKELVSAPLNFRQNKAFLLFNAPAAGTRFLIDDIVVDLIPVDDLIPFVEVDSTVRTIAALETEPTNDGKSGMNPDSFYDQLTAKASVEAPASVSNAVSAPSEPAEEGPRPRGGVTSNKSAPLSEQEMVEIVRFLKDKTHQERVAYFKSRRLGGMDRARILGLLAQQQGQQ